MLVTIAYLACLAHQNRLLLEQSVGQQAASMLRANIDGWNHMFASILADPASIDHYGRIKAGGEIEEGDRERAELMAFMLFLNLENFIPQNQMTPFAEGAEKVVRAATAHHVRAMLSSAVLKQWWEREKVVFSAQLRKAVDRVALAPN